MTEETNNTVKVGEWILTSIILAIPLVGFIMLFVWGFGNGTKPSKANYCKSVLLLAVIGIVLAIVLSIAGFSIFGNILNRINWY